VSKIGNRFGGFCGWWSEQNAFQVYLPQYALLNDSACRSYADAQFVASFIDDPAAYGGNFSTAIDLALGTSIRYMEIWNNDLLNSTLASIHSSRCYTFQLYKVVQSRFFDNGDYKYSNYKFFGYFIRPKAVPFLSVVLQKIFFVLFFFFEG